MRSSSSSSSSSIQLLAFSLLFSLFLLANPINGRKGPEEYWKQATNGEAMPKALRDQLVVVNRDGKTTTSKHFVKDFDTTPVNIIYRKHMDHQTKN